jgi:copper chaperone NosL
MLFVIPVFSGCDKPEETISSRPPMAIEASDECHICGMIIVNFPGPKGEVYTRGSETPLKFCSTRDLFSYLLQPENKTMVTQIYVHDMGATGWEHPASNAFIDARSAWYVADQPFKGAMGPTLSSFKTRQQAEAFIEEHGGRLYRFEEITLARLANLKGGTINPSQP